MIPRTTLSCKLFFIMLLITFNSFAQKKTGTLHISGAIRVEKGDATGAVVTLKNLTTKKVEDSIKVVLGGRFDFYLSYFMEYSMEVVKEGHYTKYIDVSTSVPSQVWAKDSIFPPFEIRVLLYRVVPKIKMSFEGKSIGKISYSPTGKLDNFDAKIYISDKDIRNEIDQALKTQEDEIFNKLLSDAADFEKKNMIKEAIKAYEEALALRKNDQYVKPKIKELYDDLKNLEKDALLEGEFRKLLLQGDENVAKIKFAAAVDNYKAALSIKQGDKIASDKLTNAQRLLDGENAEKAKREAEFDRLLAAGNANISSQKYAEAIDVLKMALKIKPENSVATARLAYAEQLFAKSNADKAQLETRFLSLLAAGDQNVTGQKYEEAIGNFNGALNLKPGNPEATMKLANAEKLLENLKMTKAKLEEEFNRMVRSGDSAVSVQMYADAISKYQHALEIKLGDKIVVVKLTNAQQLLAKQLADKEKQEAEFNRLLASGDESVTAQKYAEAIVSFKGALGIKPGEKTATAKLANAEQLLARANADKARQEAEFERLLAAGDQEVLNQKYPEGISNFKDALSIKPGNAIAAEKLKRAEQLLSKANADKEKLEAEFVRLLTTGDAFVAGEKYTEAIGDFKSALAIKAGDKTASAKLANAEQLLAKVNADKARQDAEFERLLAAGDQEVLNQKYPEGISNFKDALSIKPGNAIAAEKLKRAEQLLSKANADKEKLEAEFVRLLTTGDAFVAGEKYTEAIGDFKSALAIKAGDKTASAKLANAEQLLAKVNADKARQDAEFERLLAAGDQEVLNQKYPEGISNFKDALSIKPGNAIAAEKLKRAEQLLSKANADKEKLEAEFVRLLTTGDAFVAGEKYTEAIGNFKSALAIKAGDKTASAKLANAEQLLAKVNADRARQEAEFERLLAAGDLEVTNLKYPEGILYFKDALKIKPGDVKAINKLNEAEKLLARANADKAKLEVEFNRLLGAGDADVAAQRYSEAISNFKSALIMKAGDKTASAKLSNAEQLLAKVIADKARQEAEFERLLAAGDQEVTNQKYPEGILLFKDALKVKPGNVVVVGKINEAERLLAKMNIEKAKLENEFMHLMAAGDGNVFKQLYADAIDNFKRALLIKAGDKTATTKLANAEQLLVRQIADKERLESAFNGFISQGDANVAAKSFPEAINNYKEALKLKSGNVVAISKLQEAEKLLAQFKLEKQKAEAEQKLLADKQKRYKETVIKADQRFAAKSLTEAKGLYNEAIRILDTDNYPKEKIAEIDSLLAKQAADKLLAQKQADEERKLQGEGSYLKNIAAGDANFAKSLWTAAVFYYQEALKFKASDPYATEKIVNCNKMIDGKITSERMQEYASYIKNADADLQAKKYSSARFYYGKASNILPWESYPVSQLVIVNKLVESLDVNGTEAQYFDAIKKADDAVASKNIAIARFYYQKAISLKPEEEYPKQQLKRLSSE